MDRFSETKGRLPHHQQRMLRDCLAQYHRRSPLYVEQRRRGNGSQHIVNQSNRR